MPSTWRPSSDPLYLWPSSGYEGHWSPPSNAQSPSSTQLVNFPFLLLSQTLFSGATAGEEWFLIAVWRSTGFVRRFLSWLLTTPCLKVQFVAFVRLLSSQILVFSEIAGQACCWVSLIFQLHCVMLLQEPLFACFSPVALPISLREWVLVLRVFETPHFTNFPSNGAAACSLRLSIASLYSSWLSQLSRVAPYRYPTCILL